MGKLVIDKVTAKICGDRAFPVFQVEDDPEDTAFLKAVQKAAKFRKHMRPAIRKCLTEGSSFARFYFAEGTMVMDTWDGKFCYPVFDPTDELESIDVKYLFDDWQDLDAKGKPKRKWYKITLTKTTDTLFDNPEYKEAVEPQFKPVEVTKHNFGFVQGEWFHTGKDKFSPDGPSLLEPILDFIDELNYSLSQTSQAVSYNQDPQMVMNKMDEEEIEDLIRSSQKAWNLGREGEAKFVESTMKGVEAAELFRDEGTQSMLNVVRVVLHDPEKMVAAAQSGRALEILHGPLVELVDELRTVLEDSLVNLLVKISMAFVAMAGQGLETTLTMPAGFAPTSLDISTKWPAMFPLTLTDMQLAAGIANQLATANIFSRETMTRWLAPEFDVEDIDEELSKIAAQPVMNPFGDMGGPPQ